MHGFNIITEVSLISNSNESDHRKGVQHLAAWCGNIYLTLNNQKTKELIVDLEAVNISPSISMSGRRKASLVLIFWCSSALSNPILVKRVHWQL